MTTLKLTGHLERAINVALLAMLALVLLLATVDLGWIILEDLLTPPVFLLDADELLKLFGAFLLVMMGLELLDTVKIYITQKTIHVEVVLLVGIIAIARKVVILEPKGMDALSLIGIAAIIFSLTAGLLLREARRAKWTAPHFTSCRGHRNGERSNFQPQTTVRTDESTPIFATRRGVPLVLVLPAGTLSTPERRISRDPSIIHARRRAVARTRRDV